MPHAIVDSFSATPKLQALVVRWLDDVKNLRRLSPHTLAAYAADMHSLLQFMVAHGGKIPCLDDMFSLSLMDWRAWLASLSASNGARSRMRRLAGVRHFFKWAEVKGYGKNPHLSYLKNPRVDKTLPRPITPDAATAMLHMAGQQKNPWQHARDQLLLLLLYGAGLRISEALGLCWRDVVGQSQLVIVGKGNKPRMVPLLPALQQAVSDFYQAQPATPQAMAPVFKGARGEKLHAGVVQRLVRQWRRQLGLPDSVTPHALRHSFATHLLASGADLRSLQELLGHASLSTTQVYTKIEDIALQKTYFATPPRARR